MRVRVQMRERRRRLWRGAALASVVILQGVVVAGPLQASEHDALELDRVALRFVSPETGGAARPRFITERELALFTWFEAAMDRVALGPGEYPERYVRAAADRLVARTMLASLMIQRGSEPPDLPHLIEDARADLVDRLGGSDVLEQALRREGIDEPELASRLRDQVRAAWYVDRMITPIFAVSDDAVRETFRSNLHPFRSMKLDEAKPRLRRWLAVERLRSAELEFLQAARARVKMIAAVHPDLARGTTDR